MAVDTRNKRASILGIGLAAALVLPSPDGSVDAPDRPHVSFTYVGFTIEAPEALPSFTYTAEWRTTATYSATWQQTLTYQATHQTTKTYTAEWD